MQLHERQKEIVKDNHRFKVIDAGRRFGKTVLSIEEMLFKAVSTKDAKIAYIAPTYQQARDIAWEQLKARVEPIKAEINESRLEVTVPNQYKGNSKIVLRSWDNIETLRGQSFHLLILDEVASMKSFETGWKEVLRPALTDHKGGTIFISTPKGFNHFYSLFQMQNKDKDFKSFKFTSYDNPHLDPKEIDKAKEELNEDQFYQEYMADFRKMEGLVYKEFNRVIHLYDPDVQEPQNIKEYLGGVDFGFTNPCAVVGIIKDYDDNYWVTDEFYERGKTDAEIAEYVSQKQFHTVYADPENPAGVEELKRKHINCRDVSKSPVYIKGKKVGSIKSGINKIRDLLKQNRLKINKNCYNLIWELETYHYPDKKDDRNEEETPVKENDHLLDALRYVIMSSRPSRPEIMQAGYKPTREKSNIGL